jgi:glutaredoxin
MVKEFFKEKKIDYAEKDVSIDDKAREEMVERSHQMGVPVIDIEGEIFVGFDKDALSNALGI